MLKTGLYANIDPKIYRQWDAVSRSDMSGIAKGFPLSSIKYYMDHPSPESIDMVKGTALHMLVLEPERFRKEVVLAPDRGRRSNADKEFWEGFEAENQGKYILKPDDMDEVHNMASSLLKIPELQEALNGGHEISCYFEIDGIPCKCRFDILDGQMCPWDLKTTKDARYRPFGYSLEDYGYDMQAWFYTEGLRQLGYDATTMIFACVEKTPPYNTICYQPTDKVLRAGEAKCRKALPMLAEAKRTNHWPGYPAGITPLTISDTALERAEELSDG